MFKSKVASYLVGGAALVIMLLIAALSYEYSITNNLYRVMSDNVVASKKMHTIASLVEVARARTRMTGEMLVVEDIFARDEIALELDKLASRFADLRAQLMELPLTERDHELLRQQEQIIPVILINQRRASDLAMADDEESSRQAMQILYSSVFPGQGKVIDYFMEMLREARDSIRASSESAVETHRQSTFSNLILLIVTMFIMLAVTLFIIRRVVDIERSLFIEKEQAQLTLSSIGDVVIITDSKGRISNINNAFQRIFGKNPREAIGAELDNVFAGSEPSFSELVNDVMEKRHPREAGINLSDAFDDRNFYLTATISPILNTNSTIFGVVISIRDMTEQKKLTDQIAYQATYDQMTGLLNRHSFEGFCRAQIMDPDQGQMHALAVIDLDRFKVINDTSGHAAGDEALIQISNIISSRIRKLDRAARIGGDEFTVFLRDCDRDSADAVLNGIRQMVEDYRLIWEDKVFTLGCSIGYVIIDNHETDFTEAFQVADTACYLSKDAGRNRVTYLELSSVSADRNKEEVNWIPLIREALEKDLFVLHAQPILPGLDDESSLLTREILLRMNTDNGMVLPEKFFPSAERADLLPEIDLYVLGKVLQILDSGRDSGVFCINLAAKTVASTDVIDWIFSMIEASGVVPDKLCFEVSEMTLIAQTDHVTDLFIRLKQLGCRTALDDFGSGLSSFHYLEEVPLDYLKIHGTLIQRVLEKKESRLMVESIHNIARTIGFSTVAESVDSEQLYETLKRMGIDCYQGFYLGRPYPIAARPSQDRNQARA
jgi:diguanylate cyclase (GGDEF)-like protein/PAS domain S-box-containing protein